ncbi:MAG: GAF domain-containing sensor histidine kinase [Bacteroidetes bacterium]|nr:GAF domain-containing sensor histidine kinase [Bacteroidota bacterium]
MTSHNDDLIPKYVEVTEELRKGHYDVQVPLHEGDDISILGESLQNLAHDLEHRYSQISETDKITTNINQGFLLEDILESVYKEFKQFIPYDRIGFALLEQHGRILRAFWSKSEFEETKIKKGYAGLMSESSLKNIIETGVPRIINDLEEYYHNKPTSHSSRLAVEEGIRSSLTCPLISNGVAVGFMFFSSREKNTYAEVHIATYQRIVRQLSIILEKGRLVSELSDQKNTIEKKNEELKRLDELKNVFLGIAAHDLRNPISSIRGIAEMMLDERFELTNEEKKEFLSDIYDQSNFMLNLLNDLLDITTIESGKFLLNIVPIQSDEYFEQILERHLKLAEPKETNIIIENVDKGLINADVARFRQIVDNLISNAVKFSPPKSTIKIRVLLREPYWKIEVQDEGPGITEKDREKLFQDFAKLSAQPTGGEKSTGLGLSIVRKIVNAHGGKIGVDSEPGHGATFWFTIPVKPKV